MGIKVKIASKNVGKKIRKKIKNHTIKKTRALTLILILILIPTSPLHATTQTQLTILNKNIASIKIALQKDSTEKTHLQNTVTKLETTESAVTQQLKKTTRHLSQNQHKLTKLKQQTIPLVVQDQRNREALRQQIRAAFMLNQQPFMKLLLSPNDIAKTQRYLIYFHYLAAAQLQTLTQLEKSIAAYQQNQHTIQHQSQQLLTLQQTQIQNQKNLQKTKTQRQALIHTISQSMQSKNQTLQLLLQNKEALEKTIARLNQQIYAQHLSAAALSHQRFALLRGKLSWPLSGHIRNRFGTPIEQSELKWDGILIDARVNETVHAIAAGTVIFAKWLAGYGLLVIINHGSGYMTLYGRNQSLSVKTGDRVAPGQVIATVGKSGGFLHNALYFSIRHNGTALDPANWCKA